MATTSTSTAVAAVESVFTQSERLALAGFLAGYTPVPPGKTWLPSSGLRLAGSHRPGLEAPTTASSGAPARHPGEHKQRALIADGLGRPGLRALRARGADLGKVLPRGAALPRGPPQRSGPPGCG